jgi:RimJ/RimL family protein N-acetyltransferase
MSVIPHPYSLQDAEQWIATASNQSPETHFAVAIDDIVVGGIRIGIGNPGPLGARKHSGEIGYWLGEPLWGRGIMSEAVQALSEWAFRELGLVRLHAAVFARNPASARVLAKAGYEYEGRMRACYFRDGEYIDGLLYAKVRLHD